VPLVRRPAFAVVITVVLLALAINTPGAADSGGCITHRTASMLVPIPTATPPPFPVSGIDIGFENVAGLWIYVHQAWVVNVDQGTQFYLWPTGGGNVAGQQLPDFNVAFYRQVSGTNAQLVGTFNNVGPVTGVVPDAADRALVWMRTGPESPLNPDGNPFGTEWNYRDGCNGTPANSPWK
jgi:hypothetical protein